MRYYKVTALTNPLSGHGTAVAASQLAIARLHHRGVEVIEIVGENAEDARYLVGAAVEKGTDAVVVTGGDGVIPNALQVWRVPMCRWESSRRAPVTITPVNSGFPQRIPRPPRISSWTAGRKPLTWAGFR